MNPMSASSRELFACIRPSARLHSRIASSLVSSLEILMHTKLICAASLALLLGACTKKAVYAPPSPPNKELLIGKWKTDSPTLFVLGYDFAADGSVKTHIHGLKEPIPAHFTWNGERAIDVEYKPEDQKKLKEAAKVYKDWVRAEAKNKKEGAVSGRAEASMLGRVPDDPPVKETFNVSLTEKPQVTLTLRTSDGGSTIFDKAE